MSKALLQWELDRAMEGTAFDKGTDAPRPNVVLSFEFWPVG